MTETATSAQSTFNLLLGIALPGPLRRVGVHGLLASGVERTSATPNAVAGGEFAAGNNTCASVAWITITTSIVLFFARSSAPTTSSTTTGRAAAKDRTPSGQPAGATQAETAALAGTGIVVAGLATRSCRSRSSPSSGSSPTATRPLAASSRQQLILPADTTIAFNVTSLDVIHSFWAYQLGVKADANPSGEQRRLHRDEEPGRLRRPVLGAVRDLARGDVQRRQGRLPVGVHGWAQSTESANARQHRRTSRPSRGPTCPTPTAPPVATTSTAR